MTASNTTPSAPKSQNLLCRLLGHKFMPAYDKVPSMRLNRDTSYRIDAVPQSSFEPCTHYVYRGVYCTRCAVEHVSLLPTPDAPAKGRVSGGKAA
jgi:hypothetical protein